MANAEIEISFRNDENAYGMPLYRPGSMVRGSVMIYPDEDVKCSHLYVRLLWHTEGRGTRYSETMEEQDLFQGEIKQGFPTSYDFLFTLPDQPWSYEGHYISIVWAIEVQIDVPWARDPKEVEHFVMEPVRADTAV